ncbi:Ger(x)C family spore germination protein [Paenibacillus oceani]|uniref:Ger(X)C family spore germination protein n=1 Tax=Paenibacillus oceani TaxID=2772510 RepID=A0A927CDZ9_9BACL|nr:Ger(x)C family spore germination protein [Paenibacillus oceani]MBD2866324.1 Ger(x)C family spore germination protein [Paenibacillus oceani]
MRKSVFSLLAAVALAFSSGCATDVKDIEKLNYASALGVDYKDGHYYGYIQFIDFQSVAKTDNQKPAAKIWVGEGIGKSFEEAFFDLYRSAQERIYWGHVTAVLISESAFKQGFTGISDSISRYYEFRLTPWVFGTRDSIKEIFTAAGFFGQSPLSTILHEPEGTYSQASLIKSVQLHRLIGQIYEPGYTSCIPTIALNRTVWQEKQKKEPKLMLDGAIFLKNEKFRSYIPLKELEGLRWVQHGTVRAAIPVPNKSDSTAQIVFDEPKTKLTPASAGEQLRFNITMKAAGYVVNRINNRTRGLGPLTAQAKEAIEREIRQTYENGRKHQTDVFNLEHTLYRHRYRQWKAMSQQEEPLLTEDAIRHIELDLNITHSSSQKNKRITRNE